MKVFKFGGASVKDAISFGNIKRILSLYKDDDLFIVISAMGKMTNAFEKLTLSYFEKNDEIDKNLGLITDYHYKILQELFPDKTHAVYADIELLFAQLKDRLNKKSSTNYNFDYDSIVPYGELLSSTVLSHYLKSCGFNNRWIDARHIIKTDATYREARINWDETPVLVRTAFENTINDNYKIAVTQGFIGASAHGYTTTLGREGSDFTASILAYSLNAKEVVIWKDVEGVLNADPKLFEKTEKIGTLTYFDAIELAYYGATVIHPKTIKPLENTGIPLWVKSFLNPENEGTFIGNTKSDEKQKPCFIFKFNQILISIVPFDFSFIVERNISSIFLLLSKYNVKVNLMQNSALSFSICVDNDLQKIPPLIEDLKKEFKIYYNTALELVTIRHYDDEAINMICCNKEILLEQKSRNTVQFVLRK